MCYGIMTGYFNIITEGEAIFWYCNMQQHTRGLGVAKTFPKLLIREHLTKKDCCGKEEI
jgi:hypothetical protein